MPVEGETQRLHPAYVQAGYTAVWIATGVLAAIALVSLVPATLAGGLRGWRLLLVSAGVAVLIAAISAAWRALVRHDYEHTTWSVSPLECEIRHGIFWRKIVTVPRSRIQHMDVTQGPLQRAYGLSTLVLFTAGREHAQIPLKGLAFDTAMAVRQYLAQPADGNAVSGPSQVDRPAASAAGAATVLREDAGLGDAVPPDASAPVAESSDADAHRAASEPSAPARDERVP